jgi:group II intron reverse transcriptase/maturase
MKIGTKNVDKQNQRTIPITLEMVKAAYNKVRSKGNAAGIDDISLRQFQEGSEENLYVVYNRMSSGSYFPPGVKQVKIPKANGKTRNLGIPTVRDRVAQTVIKELIEPRIDEQFCEESYGCRPNKSAHQALDKVRTNCWKKPWVIDLDIKNYFNTIDHKLLMKAVDVHVKEKWVKMYIERWLEAPIVTTKGVENPKGQGTPQGGVISPLLANLFLHYAFDKWMKQQFPQVTFVRYMDDVIVHCVSQKQAEYILNRIRERLGQCKLELNEEKTSIVYCKHEGRNENYPKVTFDFLGYRFRPMTSYNRRTKQKFLGFNASISMKSQVKIVEQVKEKGSRINCCKNIEDVAKVLNPSIRGWLNYYGYIGKRNMSKVFLVINRRLVRWLRKKYKRLKKCWKQSFNLLEEIRQKNPTLFAHWAVGF